MADFTLQSSIDNLYRRKCVCFMHNAYVYFRFSLVSFNASDITLQISPIERSGACTLRVISHNVLAHDTLPLACKEEGLVLYQRRKMQETSVRYNSCLVGKLNKLETRSARRVCSLICQMPRRRDDPLIRMHHVTVHLRVNYFLM